MRIRVLISLLSEQGPVGPQVFDHLFIGVKDILAGPFGGGDSIRLRDVHANVIIRGVDVAESFRRIRSGPSAPESLPAQQMP